MALAGAYTYQHRFISEKFQKNLPFGHKLIRIGKTIEEKSKNERNEKTKHQYDFKERMVLFLKTKYSGLFELLGEDRQAKEYYDSLPDYVKQSISAREQNINSFASLQDYAQNLLRNE